MLNKNEIWKTYGTSYKEMTKMLLEQAELIRLIPDKNCRIGIKPNMVSASEPSYGATTHPEVVAGIIEYLQERGCRNLVITEGSWVGDRTSAVIRVCGYDRLAKHYGVELRDNQKDSSFRRNCGGMELELCSIVKKIDFLINVPVMKGHCQTKMTCALKNLKGLIPNREKRHFHAMGLHKPIAHLASGIRQDFIVVDHICGDLDYEDGGNPVVRNCVMVARDPVLVDSYVCGLLHYDISEVPYIKMAEKLGVGSTDLNSARIAVLVGTGMPGGAGRTKTETTSGKSGQEKTAAGGASLHWLEGAEIWDEELPYADKVVAVRDMVEEVDSCSACYGYLIPALDRLRREGLLDQLKEKICIGQGYRGQQGKLGIGNCTSHFQFSVKGCPPTETDIYEALKAYISES